MQQEKARFLSVKSDSDWCEKKILIKTRGINDKYPVLVDVFYWEPNTVLTSPTQVTKFVIL